MTDQQKALADLIELLNSPLPTKSIRAKYLLKALWALDCPIEIINEVNQILNSRKTKPSHF